MHFPRIKLLDTHTHTYKLQNVNICLTKVEKFYLKKMTKNLNDESIGVFILFYVVCSIEKVSRDLVIFVCLALRASIHRYHKVRKKKLTNVSTYSRIVWKFNNSMRLSTNIILFERTLHADLNFVYGICINLGKHVKTEWLFPFFLKMNLWAQMYANILLRWKLFFSRMNSNMRTMFCLRNFSVQWTG